MYSSLLGVCVWISIGRWQCIRALPFWRRGFRLQGLLGFKFFKCLPIGPKVVPFWGSCLEFYKVIPNRNYFGAYGPMGIP